MSNSFWSFCLEQVLALAILYSMSDWQNELKFCRIFSSLNWKWFSCLLTVLNLKSITFIFFPFFGLGIIAFHALLHELLYAFSYLFTPPETMDKRGSFALTATEIRCMFFFFLFGSTVVNEIEALITCKWFLTPKSLNILSICSAMMSLFYLYKIASGGNHIPPKAEWVNVGSMHDGCVIQGMRQVNMNHVFFFYV